MNWALNIGCEMEILSMDEGWNVAQVDIRKGTNANVFADMGRLPFKGGSFKRLYSSHALEHQSYFDVPSTLREWTRVLCDGARFIIQVPDFEAIIQDWMGGKALDQAAVFGAWGHGHDKHGVAFTAVSLKRVLESVGLRVANIERLALVGEGQPGHTLKATGIKEAR